MAVETAQTTRIERSFSAVGTGRAVRTVDLKMLAAGRVVEVGFEGGTSVPAGRMLLQLDRAMADATLAEASTDFAEAESALARAVTLREQGRVAEAALEAAEAAVARSRARLSRAMTDLEHRRLLAPFAGVVGFSDIEIGSRVDTDTVVATLDDLTTLTIRFAVPERFFGDVEQGARVRAESRIYPGEVFEGVVTGVGRRLDTVSRTFEVRARIENESARLPAGAFLRVTLVFDASEGVMLPEEAVVLSNDAAHVFVVIEGRAVRRPVALGMRRLGVVEVLDGVTPGDAVIVRGVQKVRDGQPVRLLGEALQDRPASPRTS